MLAKGIKRAFKRFFVVAGTRALPMLRYARGEGSLYNQ